MRRHLGSGRKRVNREGYSELREPIKTREKCYYWVTDLVNTTMCPKSSFLYFVSLYFSTMRLGKQIISTNVVSFNLIHYFHTRCAIFWLGIFDLCTSAPSVHVREYIFQPHLVYFQSPNCSNSFLTFFFNITKDKRSKWIICGSTRCIPLHTGYRMWWKERACQLLKFWIHVLDRRINIF